MIFNHFNLTTHGFSMNILAHFTHTRKRKNQFTLSTKKYFALRWIHATKIVQQLTLNWFHEMNFYVPIDVIFFALIFLGVLWKERVRMKKISISRYAMNIFSLSECEFIKMRIAIEFVKHFKSALSKFNKLSCSVIQ